jgi:AraC-like DNA-binding protein
MTVWLNRMIERCIRRARSGACATCDHKEACAAGRWDQVFGLHQPATPDKAPAAAAASRPNSIQRLLGELAEALRNGAGSKNGFSRDVEAKIETLLAQGDVTAERVARDLGCSRQTLYRRLKDEGVTFEQLLDRTRQRLARRYLREEGLGVKQTAYRLGFSDPSAFSRAFKRWTGHSPSQVRG